MQDIQQRRWPTPAVWVVWSIGVIVAVNAVAFASAVANPLIYSDNWTFIDTFLRVAIEEGAGPGDYLVKRAGLDHAQPLGKLLMWLNYRWFGLDFALEGRVAIGCALAGWSFLAFMALRAGTGAGDVRREDAGVAWLLVVALLAVQLSLNSPDVYAYPMVTMAHAFYLLAFVMMAVAWNTLRGGHRGWLLLSTLACGLVGDDSAILLGAAIVLAAGLAGWRERRWRAAARVAVVVAVGLVLCRLVYAGIGEVRGATNPDFNVSMAERIAALAAQWRDAWQWVSVPLSAGIVDRVGLGWMFGEGWLAARLVLTAVVLAAHAWFWRAAWRGNPGAAWFIAIATMLLFYALVAGILFGRVFVRGAGFLEQTRYVVFYQLGMVALLTMAIASIGQGLSRAMRGWAVLAAVAVLAAQVPLSLRAWQSLDGYRGAYVAMARDMAAMALDPVHPPPGCTLGVDICVRPEATRVALMRMLVLHEVNLFSPRFRARHPALAEAADQSGSPPPVVAP